MSHWIRRFVAITMWGAFAAFAADGATATPPPVPQADSAGAATRGSTTDAEKRPASDQSAKPAQKPHAQTGGDPHHGHDHHCSCCDHHDEDHPSR